MLFIFLILTTFLFGFVVYKKKYSKLYLIAFLILLVFQWKTTDTMSLTQLDNDEKRIHEERVRYYNPSEHYVRVIFKRLSLVNFLEGDFNTLVYRLQRNFFEVIDPNIYFFGGHPRERVWANDFEKFPFIFIFPFLIGLYYFIVQKKWLFFFVSSINVLLLSFIGHKNPLGSFILFPVIVVLTSEGFIRLVNWRSYLPSTRAKPIFIVAGILILLSVIQTFIYAY